MQYFTKQELQGGVRYGSKCMVGNWNENVTLDEVRVASRPRDLIRSICVPPPRHVTTDRAPRPVPRPRRCASRTTSRRRSLARSRWTSSTSA